MIKNGSLVRIKDKTVGKHICSAEHNIGDVVTVQRCIEDGYYSPNNGSDYYNEHDLEVVSSPISVGDRVRVKAGVRPSLDWGAVKPGDIGTVTSIEGNMVEVSWACQSVWYAPADELEVVNVTLSETPHPFKVGDKVRVKESVTSPARGWGYVKHGDVGTIASLHTNQIVVDFPNHKGWQAIASELEKVSSDSLAEPPHATREYVTFETIIGKNGQPKGVICKLKSTDGKFHIGVSKCNKDAGDIFLRKVGRAEARRRAEFARDTHTTAYFKNGGVCMAYDFQEAEKDDQ